MKRTYSSMLEIYGEIKDGPREAMNDPTKLAYAVKSEYFDLYNREKESLADKKFDMEVAVSLVVEVTF